MYKYMININGYIGAELPMDEYENNKEFYDTNFVIYDSSYQLTFEDGMTYKLVGGELVECSSTEEDEIVALLELAQTELLYEKAIELTDKEDLKDAVNSRKVEKLSKDNESLRDKLKDRLKDR